MILIIINSSILQRYVRKYLSMNDADEEQSILNNEIKRVKHGIIPDEKRTFSKKHWVLYI